MKSKSKRRKEKKKVGRGIRVKIGNSIKIDKIESMNEIYLEKKSKQKVKFDFASLIVLKV